jgi:sec-independent protein translocase protein TatC
MQEQDENIITHLEALRKMLIKCLVALAVLLLPMFLLAPYALDWLIKIILQDSNITLNYFTPMEVFMLQLKIAAVLDILVCFPYIARQVWLFLLPALYDNERRFIKSMVLASSALFITGVLFCLFFILPLIINFGIGFSAPNLQAMFGVGNIIGLALTLSLIFGIMFQFPLVTYFLICFNVLSYNQIKHLRPYVFVGILILAGILTPPDVVSQLMLTIPTYLLFEIGLIAGKRCGKK